MKEQRIIQVTGKGQLKIRPDLTKITLSIKGMSSEYAQAVQESAAKTQQLQEMLAVFGFGRADLKTLYFSVDPEYERYEEHKIYKQRLAGYQFEHTLKIEFESDSERLGKILYALANCSLKPEFQISYTVKDREAARNQLLGKAVEDAKEKAAVLANAAGVVLGEIQSIDYSWDEVELEVRPMRRMMSMQEDMSCASESYAMDMEPDDIEVSDHVTVIWNMQ